MNPAAVSARRSRGAKLRSDQKFARCITAANRLVDLRDLFFIDIIIPLDDTGGLLSER